jgi:hypothetical protein
MDYFVANIHRLLQSELDRYLGSIQLIQDYYNIIEGKEITEPPEHLLPDFPYFGDTPAIEVTEDPNSFPRIEKMTTDVLKVLNGEEIEDPNAANIKGGKQPPKQAPKVDDKKKGAKKGGKEELIEEKKELSPLEKEAKRAVLTEKAIFRYRVTVIKNMAISKLKEMRFMAKALYNKLEDWIVYSIRAENDAITVITRIMRRAIENQEKLQKELQLNYVDVVINHKYLNFLTPPPILLPAKEIGAPHRFTITQLYLALEELRTLANENDTIDNKILLQYFVRRTSGALSKDDFPQEWQGKDIKAFQRLIRNLDPRNVGFVNLKLLSTYLCLLSTQLPQESDISSYKRVLDGNAKNGVITRENFLETPCFFDGFEATPHLEHNSMYFDRVQIIKDILFNLHSEKNKNTLVIDNYLRVIRPIETNNETVSPLKSPSKKSPTRSPNKSALRSPPREFQHTYSTLLFD